MPPELSPLDVATPRIYFRRQVLAVVTLYLPTAPSGVRPHTKSVNNRRCEDAEIIRHLCRAVAGMMYFQWCDEWWKQDSYAPFQLPNRTTQEGGMPAAEALALLERRCSWAVCGEIRARSRYLGRGSHSHLTYLLTGAPEAGRPAATLSQRRRDACSDRQFLATGKISQSTRAGSGKLKR